MSDLKLLIIALVWLALAGLVHEARAVDHAKPFGEPCEIVGKRIVFTTWYWVRQGETEWYNAAGKSVFADVNEKADPLDAHFENINGPWGVRLIAEQAKRGGKLPVEPKSPWEARGISIRQMLPLADGRIMAWGDCIDDKGATHGCYLESTDGATTWTRPKLGLVEFNGSKENNLTSEKVPGRVFFDPSAPPLERFKSANNGSMSTAEFKKLREQPDWVDRPISIMAVEDDQAVDSVVCVFGYFSPDGVRWIRLLEPLTIEESDGDQCVYFDLQLKKYVMYLRGYSVAGAPGYPVDHAVMHKRLPRRMIARSESADFRHFPLSETVVEGSNEMGPTDTYYLACRTTIPGAPEFHLMFPTRYIVADDNMALDLYTSFDGKIWHIAPGCPLLRTADFGHWDGGSLFFYPNLVERAGGDWVLIYRGDNFPHKYPRGKQTIDYGTAVWPKGRLMAIEAVDKGFFATPAFLAPGAKVRINALIARTGEIRVEVADLDGKPIAGHSFADANFITGDQYRAPFTWKGSDALGVAAGKPVMLRFQMNKAKIYGLDFE